MKTNSNNSIYSNYKIIGNSFIVTLFPNKSNYCIIDEKQVNQFRKLKVTLKSIVINLNLHILSFQDDSTTIAVAAETTTITHSTTITITINNNNIIYFIKLSGISQGDPMEGFPQYSGGIEENDQRV